MACPVHMPHGLTYDDNIYSVGLAGEKREFRYILYINGYDRSKLDHFVSWNLMPVKTPAQMLLFEPRYVPFPSSRFDPWTTIHELRPYWRNWLDQNTKAWAISPQGEDTYDVPQIFFEHEKDLNSFIDECYRHLDNLRFSN